MVTAAQTGAVAAAEGLAETETGRPVGWSARLSAGRWLAPAMVALLALGMCRLALLPGLAYWDTAELQSVGPLMGTAHPTGFPTYVLLAWLASVVLQPFGDPALRMNLLAASCVALAAGVTVDLVRALTRSTALGVMAGIGLAATPIVWAIGTHAETHALHLALLAVLVCCLVAWQQRRADRTLVAAVIVFGLAVGNHSLSLLLIPAIGLFVLAVEPSILRRPGFMARLTLTLAVTLAILYLELPLRAGPFRAPLVYGQPATWDGFWYIVLAEQFRGSLFQPFQHLDIKAAELAGRAFEAFGPLVILIPAGFLATVVRQPRYALLSGLATAVTCFFAASYVNADIGRYYLGPALFAWTWLAVLAAVVVERLGAASRSWSGAAAAWAADTGRRRGNGAIALGLALILLGPTILAAPARLSELDRSHDVRARQWLEHALAAMAPDAVVVSWWSYSTPLWYAQRVEGRRPDIAIIDDRTRLDQDLGDITDVIDANLSTRPVYVIRSDPDEIVTLARRYVLRPIEGVQASGLSLVVARRSAGW